MFVISPPLPAALSWVSHTRHIPAHSATIPLASRFSLHALHAAPPPSHADKRIIADVYGTELVAEAGPLPHSPHCPQRP